MSARRGELHVSAISIHAYAYVADKYALLPSGASMGDGYGPIVVRKRRNRETAKRPKSSPPDVLTSRDEIQYHGGRFETDKESCPIGPLSVRIPVTHKKTTKHDRERERAHSMYSLNQVKTLASCGRDPARSLPLWRGFLLIPLILVCFALSPQAQATCVDGCNNNFGTFQGDDALPSSAGNGNSAFGWRSLTANSTGSFNTAMGPSLILNTTGTSNTAVGAAALLLNTGGNENTAVGTDALVFNTGSENTAVGAFALFNHTTGVAAGLIVDANCAFGDSALLNDIDGFSNNAYGNSAMFQNIHGTNNTAVGDLALQNNDVTGDGDANFNTALGAEALFSNENGSSNNAVGFNALGANVDGLANQAMGADALAGNVDGASNIGIGDAAMFGNGGGSFNTMIGDDVGPDLTSGSDNIYIGATAGAGVTTEDGTIRIGDPLHVGSCFIAGITDQTATGGSAVFVDADGKLGTVASGAGKPLSANELLKEQQVVQELKATTEKQAARIALQEQQIQTLTAALKQQAEQIQKVSAQLEMIRPAPRVVGNR
jgi:hypothetical protein